MAKPITIHTLESLLAQTIEVGECMEWQGYYATGKYTPYVYHEGKMIAVRKLLAMLTGRDLSNCVYFASSCDNWRCVNPAHIVGRASWQHLNRMSGLVDHGAAQRVAKLQEVARARVGKLTEAGAEAIRLDDRPLVVVAADYGISKSLVSKVKTGRAWRQVSASVNPWGGLMR